MPVSSLPLRTTAPAPSPKRIAVERSFQSTILERVSLPTTNTLLAAPVLMNCSAVVNANTKPEHTDCKSKAGHEAPIAYCSMVAVAGKILSGVVVARIIRSKSDASMPAISSALLEAISAKSQVLSLVTRWRCLMPVREVIHSSVVSIVFDKSSLVMTVGGR